MILLVVAAAVLDDHGAAARHPPTPTSSSRPTAPSSTRYARRSTGRSATPSWTIGRESSPRTDWQVAGPHPPSRSRRDFEASGPPRAATLRRPPCSTTILSVTPGHPRRRGHLPRPPALRQGRGHVRRLRRRRAGGSSGGSLMETQPGPLDDPVRRALRGEHDPHPQVLGELRVAPAGAQSTTNVPPTGPFVISHGSGALPLAPRRCLKLFADCREQDQAPTHDAAARADRRRSGAAAAGGEARRAREALRLRRRGERSLECGGGALDLARDVAAVFGAGVFGGEGAGERADEPERCAQRLVHVADRRPRPSARVLFP